MEIKEFAEKVQKAVAETLGREHQVKIQEVQKNNNVRLQGLVILSKDQNISPTIYLNSFWEVYEAGVSFSAIIERILRIYEDDTPKESVDMSFFKDFDSVKERICYRLVSMEQNQELLKKVPHIEYLNLAICFYYAYQGESLGTGSILIHNTHVKMWQSSTEQLFGLAQNNTPRLFPCVCNSMKDVVREMIREQEEDAEDSENSADICSELEEQERILEQIPMHVLSNERRVYGAACILYPDLLKELACKEEMNLYILPSSVHEVVLLSDNGQEDAVKLREMVGEVNATQVEPEEFLSDSLYYYNRFSCG